MRTTAADVSIPRCVCKSVTRPRPAKTAERIHVAFGVGTLGGPGNTASGGSPILIGGVRRKTKNILTAVTINTPDPTHSHSPDDATSHATIAKSLWLLFRMAKLQMRCVVCETAVT